jgi:hypothetical protein
LPFFFPNGYTGFPFLDQPCSPTGAPGGKANGGFFLGTGYHGYILLLGNNYIDKCLIKASFCGIFPSKTPSTPYLMRKYPFFNLISKLDAKSKSSQFIIASEEI